MKGEIKMQWMYNMKIGAKLIVSFIIVALITGIVGIVGIMNLQTLQNSNKLLYEKMTVPIAEVGQISTSYQRMRVIVRDMIIENSPELIQSNADKVVIRMAKLTKPPLLSSKPLLIPRCRHSLTNLWKLEKC